MEPLPEFGSLSDGELKAMIGDLEQQERDVSYQRRLLHGKIDILRAELVARLKTSGGRSVLDQVDVDRLTEILSGKAAPPVVSVVYCSECGFQNPEAANYCSRCGALLSKGESSPETTQTFSAAEVGEHMDHEDLGLEGPALVVRAGGGRAGESFKPAGERTRIGRSPDCEVFLDDVTVSRNHAVLIERDGGFVVEDQGSLNGTFVNRKRIESAPLAEGDELQIGKYRMTFIA